MDIKMKDVLNSVEEFHKSFGHPVAEAPCLIKDKRAQLRFELMFEELEEYLHACHSNDKVEIADALGDMLYILAGTILEHGMQDKIKEVFDEIHRSNMSKLGKDGKPIYREDGKILKGPDYFRPDIKQFIK